MQHGRYSTYVNHKCRCVDCRAAWTAYSAERAAERRRLAAAGEIEVPHGTDGGYRNYGCRCDDCRRAHNQMRRAGKRRALIREIRQVRRASQ
jgi:hypothetical protein